MGVAGTLVLATVVLGIIAFAAFSERGRRRRWSDTLQQLCDARPDLKRHDSPGWSRVYGSVGRFAQAGRHVNRERGVHHFRNGYVATILLLAES